MEQDVQNKELIEAETQDTDSVVVTETVEHDENTSVIATIDKAEEKGMDCIIGRSFFVKMNKQIM